MGELVKSLKLQYKGKNSLMTIKSLAGTSQILVNKPCYNWL